MCLKYQQQIFDFEKSNFVSLVFSCIGERPTATLTIKQLASKVAEKKVESYSDAITYIRERISFALLCSAIRCHRGCRGLKWPTDIDSSCSVTVQEGE